MAKDYTKTTWVDEVLDGSAVYDVGAGGSIGADVPITLTNTVLTPGTAVNAARLNNIETMVDENDSFLRDTSSEVTVSSGVLTVTKSRHKVQPESGTADDIDTISGIASDTFLILFASDKGTDTLTLKHGTGNISCEGGSDVDFSSGFVIVYYDGTTVYVLGGGGGSSTLADLTDTTIATPTADEFLRYSGSAWVNEEVVVDPTLRLLSGPLGWDDDFSGGLSAPPSGWAWAGSPFVTPDTIAYDSKIMSWRDTTVTAMRNFLYKSWTPGTPSFIDLSAWLAGTFFTNAFFQGIRIDDGTDNNYCEFGQYRSTTGNPIQYWSFHRVGGGSVVSAELDTSWQMVMPPPFMVISMALRGTFWSNWDYRGQLWGDFAYQKTPAGATGKTWTPSRYGITSRRTTYTWDTTKLARFTVETT